MEHIAYITKGLPPQLGLYTSMTIATVTDGFTVLLIHFIHCSDIRGVDVTYYSDTVTLEVYNIVDITYYFISSLHAHTHIHTRTHIHIYTHIYIHT